MRRDKWDGLERMDSDLLHFFQKYKHRDVIESYITLVICNQINLMERFSELKCRLELK